MALVKMVDTVVVMMVRKRLALVRISSQTSAPDSVARLRLRPNNKFLRFFLSLSFVYKLYSSVNFRIVADGRATGIVETKKVITYLPESMSSPVGLIGTMVAQISQENSRIFF